MACYCLVNHWALSALQRQEHALNLMSNFGQKQVHHISAEHIISLAHEPAVWLSVKVPPTQEIMPSHIFTVLALCFLVS